MDFYSPLILQLLYFVVHQLGKPHVCSHEWLSIPELTLVNKESYTIQYQLIFQFILISGIYTNIFFNKNGCLRYKVFVVPFKIIILGRFPFRSFDSFTHSIMDPSVQSLGFQQCWWPPTRSKMNKSISSPSASQSDQRWERAVNKKLKP